MQRTPASTNEMPYWLCNRAKQERSNPDAVARLDGPTQQGFFTRASAQSEEDRTGHTTHVLGNFFGRLLDLIVEIRLQPLGECSANPHNQEPADDRRQGNARLSWRDALQSQPVSGTFERAPLPRAHEHEGKHDHEDELTQQIGDGNVAGVFRLRD